MPFATSEDGVRIHYGVAGRDDGPPVVLLHGVPHTSARWSMRGDTRLPGTRFRMLMVDQRDHGESEEAAEIEAYDPCALVLDAIAVPRPAPHEHAYLLGFSLGRDSQVLGAHLPPQRFMSMALSGMDPTRPLARYPSVLGHVSAAAEDFPADRRPATDAYSHHLDRWQGARETVRTTSVPLLGYRGERDPSFDRMRSASQLNPAVEFLAVPYADHFMYDARSVALICERAGAFFEALPS